MTVQYWEGLSLSTEDDEQYQKDTAEKGLTGSSDAAILARSSLCP